MCPTSSMSVSAEKHFCGVHWCIHTLLICMSTRSVMLVHTFVNVCFQSPICNKLSCQFPFHQVIELAKLKPFLRELRLKQN